MPDTVTVADATKVVPVPPEAPGFNPFDPISVTWYCTAVLTVIGFVLHKDLSNYAGPIGAGVFAAVGIAIGLVRAMKYRSYSVALQQWNGLRLDHYANVIRPTRYALHDHVASAFDAQAQQINALKERLDVLAPIQ